MSKRNRLLRGVGRASAPIDPRTGEIYERALPQSTISQGYRRPVQREPSPWRFGADRSEFCDECNEPIGDRAGVYNVDTGAVRHLDCQHRGVA